MSGVGKVSDYDEAVGTEETFIIAKRQSSAIQYSKSNTRKIGSYLANISTIDDQDKRKIEALINKNLRVAICPRNIEYCQSIAQSLNLDDEDEEEDLIGEMEDYFEDAVEEDAFEYGKFADAMGYEGLLDWFERSVIQFDQTHEGTLLEIIKYLSNFKASKLNAEINRVEVLYEIYGNDAFPWKLPSIIGLSNRYLAHSEVEEHDDENYYEEDTDCRNNGCGSRRTKIQLFEHARTDNGKVVVKRCIKCGIIRR